MVSQIYVDELAKSYGFDYAPRVKGQGFVKKQRQNINKVKVGSEKKAKIRG